MTKRGTLAYYLAAWVIGCFVIAVITWAFVPLEEGASLPAPARFLMLYVLCLIYGAVDMLLFAFLLRRAMRLWKTHRLWIWILAGAALAAPLAVLLAWAGQAWLATDVSKVFGFLFPAVFLAPLVLRRANLVFPVVEGAATAAALCLVDRAFNRSAEETDAKPSPV